MDEAEFSAGGLAKRMRLAADRRGLDLRTSTTQVGRWLAGQQPRGAVVELLAQVFAQRLGRPISVADLGFSTKRDGSVAEPDGASAAMGRLWRADAAGVEGVGALTFAPEGLDRPVMDWLLDTRAAGVLQASLPGPPVTLDDVQVAAATLDMFRNLDHSHGAGGFRSHVVAYLAEQFQGLLARPRANAAAEAGLMRVGAGLAELAGYQAVDVGANGLAQRYYMQALTFASAAGDRAFGSHLVAANVAHLALHVGHPQEALRMVRAAQQGGQGQTSPAAQAAFFAVEARAHARLKDERACSAALLQAEAALEKSVPADEPEWIRYFTPADLEDEISHCLHDLGQHAQTQRYVRAALADLDVTRVRRLAIDTALLATSLAKDGQLEEACSVGRQAVHHASRTNSHRSTLRIIDLRTALADNAEHRAVRELDEYIREVLPRAL